MLSQIFIFKDNENKIQRNILKRFEKLHLYIPQMSPAY